MKKSFISKMLMLFIAVVAVSLLNVPLFVAFAEKYTENDEISFVARDGNNYEYLCKTLKNYSSAVSIAWADDDKSSTPTHLTIPSTLTFDGTTYDVKCISYGGFSNCDFEQVDIPNSIDEIKPEAFMCCINLTEIVLPENITEIQCATFMDCRNLVSVKYAHQGLPEDSVNEHITVIADNAFAACFKLKDISAPKTLLEIGRCAFENCDSLPYLFLPNNPITIRSYAFSKCGNFSALHVPKNVACIEDFAFTQCDNLTVYFQCKESEVPSAYGRYYTYLYSTSNRDDYKIKTQFEVPSISGSNQYPGLIYSITLNGSIVSESKKKTWKSRYSYATLLSYNRYDTDDVEGYMHNQILTLPDYVHDDATNADYPLAVIGPKAFAYHTELKGIIHNQTLVRIWYSAYQGCTEIEQLRYERCTELKEIGWRQFGNNDAGTSIGNNKIEELILPNSLEFFWSDCFIDLTMCSYLSFRTDPTADCCLGNIGNGTFRNMGKNSKKTFDLELPCSLSNYQAGQAGGSSVAVGSNSFNGAKSIRSVRMLECQHNTHGKTNDNKSQISFGDSAFNGCSNLVKFVSSHGLKTFGSNVLAGTGLKEIFLNLNFNTTANFGWNTNFLGTNGVVVYTDREPLDKTWMNPKSGYLRESTTGNSNPTDTTNSAGPVPYYVLGLGNLDTGVTYYNNGSIATVQENGGTTITQCLSTSVTPPLDLTLLDTPTPIKKIGDFAFGEKEVNTVYIPDTIEEIGDRAFLSKYSSNSTLPDKALSVFTYKIAGVVQQDPNGCSSYCRLPSTCTKVGKHAFFNNAFQSVTTDASSTTFGISAFSTSPKLTTSATGHEVSSRMTYFDKTHLTLPNTSWSGDALYYDQNGNHYGLLYCMQASTTGNFVVETGTKYINCEAIFGTAATSISIPNTVTTVYPYGVAANPLLTEINGDLSGLKYINGSHLAAGDTEAWKTNHPMINNASFDNATYQGAFQRNKLLQKFDFTQLTSVYDIGDYAFNGDIALNKMSDSQPVYRYYNNSSSGAVTTKESGVFDLRNSTNLRYIGKAAFLECDKLEYMHLPDTTGNNKNRVSNLTLNNSKSFKTCNILVGERACQASPLVPNATGGTQYNTSTHYPTDSTKDSTVYYYAERKNDVSDANTGIKYWTYGATRQDFILFSNAANAKAGLPN